MFETPIIERFSRTHPFAPFVFWTPFLFYFLYRTYESGVFIPLAMALIVAGALLWSLTEYLLHRFLFHRITPTPSGRRVHFVLHGVHHDFPTDVGRLVMPLGVSIPIGVVIYLALYFALGHVAPALIDPIFVGFGVGYLAYDGIHYGTHHFKMERGVARWLKRYHMVHHHTGEEARWGVSSPLWDILLGTGGRERTQTDTVQVGR